MHSFYEILLRGNTDGTLAGGHIIPYVDGKPGTAAPIGTARATIAWPEVVAAVNDAALATIETLTAQIAAMESAVSTADSIREQLNAALAQIESLTALPEPVTSITPRQLRLYLLSIGQLALVESFLETIPGAEGEAARIEWKFSQEVRRNHPLTPAIGSMLGLDSDGIDFAFSEAARLFPS